jgi:hypothetical protein
MNDDLAFLVKIARFLASAGRTDESLKLFEGLTLLSGRKSYHAEGMALAAATAPKGSEMTAAKAMIQQFGLYCFFHRGLMKSMAGLCWRSLVCRPDPLHADAGARRGESCADLTAGRNGC